MDMYLHKLKRHSLKLTPRRRAIIEIFLCCGCHLTPEEVWKKLCNDFNKCGLPSVYRNLETLADCGVLTRIQQFDCKKHYALCTAKNDYHHHHITCIKCGKVDEFKSCSLENMRKINGYKIVNHFMQVNGICEECLV